MTIDYLHSLTFPDPPAERPYVYINMVASVDGKITVEGSERGLGSDVDKRLFYELRGHADAVLDGATTARVSGSSPHVRFDDIKAWRQEHGLSPHPLGVLITASGDLDTSIAFFTSRQFQAAVFAAETMAPDRLARLRAAGRPVHVVPTGIAAITEMVRVLRTEYGVRRLLCEGGGTVNSQFFHLGAADEIFVTVAPLIVGGNANLTPVEGDPFVRDTMPRLSLRAWQVHEPTGEVFTRWAVQH